MSGEEIAEFLATGHKLQVATNGADGYPHLTTLWYVMTEGRITFRSFTKSQRIVNLRRDPRLGVLVEAGDTYETLRGVMMQGRALLIDDRSTVLQVYGRIAAKYQGGADPSDLDPAALEALFGAYAAKNTVVIVEPTRTVSWDHRRLGGVY